MTPLPVLLITLLVTGGCTSAHLAPKIVTAPNRQGAPVMFAGNVEMALLLAQTYSAAFRVHVGPPDAEIAVAVIEPGDYQFSYGLTVRNGNTTGPKYLAHIDWRPPVVDVPHAEPRATIVLLHGFWMSKEAMLHWALELAQLGYRSIVLDLRGHGASTGPWVTFGSTEISDLRGVLDELQRRDLAPSGRIAVLGVSYGASLGLMWTAADSRIGTCIALEPISDGPAAIREYARAMLSPSANRLISDRAFASAARRAAKMAGFSWSQVDVPAAVASIGRPVLLVHGARDSVIPIYHSRALAAVAPTGSRLLELPDDDHFTLSMRLDGLTPEVTSWLDTHLPAASTGAPPPRQNAENDPEKHLASP